MRIILGLALIALLASCGNDSLINETTEVDHGEWSFNDVKGFDFEVGDTLSPHNFYLLIRHGGTYKYQNLIMIVKTYFPDNTFKSDTIDCPLADPSGRWFGNGLGDLLDNRVMFKRNVQFPLSGPYKIELQHAMRSDTVHEIYDVGLSIESAVD